MTSVGVLVRSPLDHHVMVNRTDASETRLRRWRPPSRLEPDLFAPTESLEPRLEQIEESLEEAYERLTADQRIIVEQTAANSSAIGSMRRRRR